MLEISATLKNSGAYPVEEIVQLYIRDLFASRTRPVRELKGFKRIQLNPGETKKVSFEIETDDLSFTNQDMKRITETGTFHAWIGGDSRAQLQAEFEVVE